MNRDPKRPVGEGPCSSGAAKNRFRQAVEIIHDGIAQQAFPGAAFAVVDGGELLALESAGRFTYEAGSPPVAPDTVYDVASVTKAVATTTAAMMLYERGRLDLEAPVVSLAPEFASDDPRRARVTVRMLLAHSSGLPGYVKLFETCGTREALIAGAMRTPLTADPGTRAEYSDIGFLVLGELLERVAAEPLDSFCRREIFVPLAMARTGFNPPADRRVAIPPTEHDTWFRHRVVQGEVQDENAWVMGGVAGPAGVFAPAEDLARFAQCLLRGGAPILARRTVDLFTRREAAPPGTSRALGWDTPSAPSQSGRYFSPRAFGHLGYAGTSLWIDPERQFAVALLTNRTWPDRSSQLIRQFRPRVHDAIVEALR